MLCAYTNTDTTTSIITYCAIYSSIFASNTQWGLTQTMFSRNTQKVWLSVRVAFVWFRKQWKPIYECVWNNCPKQRRTKWKKEGIAWRNRVPIFPCGSHSDVDLRLYRWIFVVNVFVCATKIFGSLFHQFASMVELLTFPLSYDQDKPKTDLNCIKHCHDCSKQSDST